MSDETAFFSVFRTPSILRYLTTFNTNSARKILCSDRAYLLSTQLERIIPYLGQKHVKDAKYMIKSGDFRFLGFLQKYGPEHIPDLLEHLNIAYPLTDHFCNILTKTYDLVLSNPSVHHEIWGKLSLIDKAVYFGHTDLINYLITVEGTVYENTVIMALFGGHFELAKLFHDNGLCKKIGQDNGYRFWTNHHQFTKHVELSAALLTKNLQICEWEIKNRYTYDAVTIQINHLALATGNLEIVKLVHEIAPNTINYNDGCMLAAFESKSLDVVQFYLNKFQYNTKIIAQAAAKSGNIDIFNHVINRIKGLAIKEDVLKAAAQSGNTELCRLVAQMMYEREPVSADLCNYIAQNGNIELLIWAVRKFDLPIPVTTMDDAIKYGHFELAKWLHDHYHNCTTKAFTYAIEGRRSDIIEWLHENDKKGCNHSSFQSAIDTDNLEILKQLEQYWPENCIWDDLFIMAAKLGRATIVKWMINISTIAGDVKPGKRVIGVHSIYSILADKNRANMKEINKMLTQIISKHPQLYACIDDPERAFDFLLCKSTFEKAVVGEVEEEEYDYHEHVINEIKNQDGSILGSSIHYQSGYINDPDNGRRIVFSRNNGNTWTGPVSYLENNTQPTLTAENYDYHTHMVNEIKDQNGKLSEEMKVKHKTYYDDRKNYIRAVSKNVSIEENEVAIEEKEIEISIPDDEEEYDYRSHIIADFMLGPDSEPETDPIPESSVTRHGDYWEIRLNKEKGEPEYHSAPIDGIDIDVDDEIEEIMRDIASGARN